MLQSKLFNKLLVSNETYQEEKFSLVNSEWNYAIETLVEEHPYLQLLRAKFDPETNKIYMFFRNKYLEPLE